MHSVFRSLRRFRLFGMMAMPLILLSVLHSVRTVRGTEARLRAGLAQEADNLLDNVQRRLEELVALGDTGLAVELTRRLRLKEELERFVLYGRDGLPLLRYRRRDLERIPIGTPPQVGVLQGPNFVRVTRSLGQGSQPMGLASAVMSTASIELEHASLVRDGILRVLGVGLACLILLPLLQSEIQRPVQRIRRFLERVERGGDYSLRLADEDLAEWSLALDGVHHLLEGIQRREAQLLRAVKEAQAAGEAKQRFLANMSHEIRTPMTAILGFTEELLRPDANDQDRVEAARVVRDNGQHLLHVVNDILDYTRLESGQSSPESLCTDIRELVENQAAAFRVQAREAGLELTTGFAGELPAGLETDPTYLRQILINLLGNAIKFTTEGGVQVHVSWEDQTPTTHGKRRGLLTLAVTDTGIGLTEEQQGQIFQAFVQADESITRRFGGTGLGLAISRKLAQALGGELGVESGPEGGSRFVLELPLDVAAEEGPPPLCPSRAQPVSLEGQALEGLRILLAEDVATNRLLIARILQRRGAQVVAVENGLLALERARCAWRGDEAFDVLLLDVQMPELDGHSVVRTLRAEGYTGRIVALTAHALEGARRHSLEAGCDDYATKPVEVGKLLLALRPELGHPMA